MILRRFTQHIKEQNWFAVGLDVIVVVVGIFLGMQVTEWNDERKDKIEWRSTLENLQAEFTINLRTTENNRKSLDTGVGAASQSLKILFACEMQAGDMELLQRGLMAARGTIGLGLRKRVLESIIADTKFQTFLTSSRKQYLQDFLTQLDFYQIEAGFYENLPFNDMPEKHSAVKLVMNEGKTYSSASLIVLAVPFEVACRDQGFIKSLNWWVRWQGSQLRAAQDLLVLLENTRGTLEKW